MTINASMAQHLLERNGWLPVDRNYATTELKNYAERLHVLNKERDEIETKIALLAKAEDDNEQTQRKAPAREHAEQEHGGSDRHGVSG